MKKQLQQRHNVYLSAIKAACFPVIARSLFISCSDPSIHSRKRDICTDSPSHEWNPQLEAALFYTVLLPWADGLSPTLSLLRFNHFSDFCICTPPWFLTSVYFYEMKSNCYFQWIFPPLHQLFCHENIYLRQNLVVEAGFGFPILLPPAPVYWNYRRVPPSVPLGHQMLGVRKEQTRTPRILSP